MVHLAKIEAVAFFLIMEHLILLRNSQVQLALRLVHPLVDELLCLAFGFYFLLRQAALELPGRHLLMVKQFNLGRALFDLVVALLQLLQEAFLLPLKVSELCVIKLLLRYDGNAVDARMLLKLQFESLRPLLLIVQEMVLE